MSSFLIAVCGGSASGKTTFARKLHTLLKDKSSILYQDNYYIDQSDKFDCDGGSVNFDHPESLEFSLMAKHLKELKQGNQVQVPVYDFATHTRSESKLFFPVTPFVIVDGILILNDPELREIFDLKIFIDAPEEVRYQRRLKRDVEERGRTEEGVYNQFYKQVAPMHNMFVEPSKSHAHKVYSGTCDFSPGLNEVYSLLMG